MDNTEKKLRAKLDVQTPKHLANSISVAVQNKIQQDQNANGLLGFRPIKLSWVFALLLIYGIGTWTGMQLNQLQPNQLLATQTQEAQTVFLAQEWMDQ